MHRVSTFFGDGIVAHVAFGDPVCPQVAKAFAQACKDANVVGKMGGTYVCMEGPQFSTKAESNLYRSWGADVIGMTNLQEAKLAREAEICYATMAMVTDYDCWHPEHDSRDGGADCRGAAHECRECGQGGASRRLRRCRKSALASADRRCKFAILTDPTKIPAATRQKLSLLLDKYLKKGQEANA